MTSFSHLLRSAPYYSPAKYTTPGQTQRQERRLHATQRPLINPYATLTADDFDTFVDDVSNRIAGALSYDREAELASKRRGYAGDDGYWLELGGKPGEFLGGAAAAPEDEVQQHQTREDDDLAEAEEERLDGRAQSAQPFPAGDPASHRSVTLVSNGDDAEGEQDREAAVDADTSMLDNLSDADEDSAEAEPEEEYNDESKDEQLDEEDQDELEEEDSGAEQATLQTRQPPSSQVEPITLDDTTDEDEGEGEAEDDEEEEEEEGQEEYDDGNGSEEDEDEDDDQEADENGHEPAQSQPRWRPAQVSRNSNVSLETDDGHLILLRDEQEDDHGEQKEAEEQDDDDGKNEANSSQGEAGMPPAVFPDSNLAFETANGNVVTLPPPSSTISSAPTAFSPTSNVYPDLAYLQDLPPQPVAQTLYPSLDGLASAGFGFIPASTLLRQAEAASPFASQHGTEPQQSLDANAGAAANPDPDVSYDMGALPELNGEGDDIMPIDLLLDAANEDVERVQEAVDKVVEADAEEDRLNAELLELVHQQQPEPSLRIDEESEMADPGAAEHGRALADDEGDESGEDERVEEEGDVNSLEQQDPQSPREQQRRSASKQESDVISIGSSSEEDETEAPPAPRRPPAAHQSQVSQQYARKTLPQTAVPAPVPSQARLMSRRVLDQLDEEDREASGYTSDGEGPVREGHLFGQEEGDADADAAALEENEDDPDAREFRRMQQGVRRRRAVEEEQDAEDAYFGEESEGDDERDSAEVEDEDEDGDAQGSEGEGSSSSAETAGAGATQQKRHRPTSTRDEFADEVDDQELDEQEERAKRFKTDADIEDRVPIPRFMKKDSSGEYVLDYSGDEAGEDEEEEEEEESEGDEEGEEDGEEEEGESNDEKEDEHGDGAAGEAIEDSTKHADGMVALQDGDGAWEKSEIDDAGPSVASASADIGSAQTANVELTPNRSTEQESVAAADAGATDEVQLAVSGTADQDPAGTGVLSPSGDVLEEILHTFEADPQEGAVVTSTSISATVSTTVQAKSSSMDDDKQEPLKTGVAPVVAETDAHSAEQPSEPAARGAHEPLNIDPASESANVQTDYSSAAAPDQASEAITAARRKSVTPAPELRDGDMASSTQPLSPSTPSTKAARSASHAPFLPQSLIIPPQEASSSVVSAISPLPAAWPQLGSASDVAEASSPALVSPTLPASLHLPAQDLTPGGPESNFATDPLAIADPKPMFAPQTHDAGAEQSDVGLDVTAASSDPALANASLDAGQAMEVDTSEPEGNNAALQGGEAKDIGDRPAHEPSAEPDEKEYTSQIPPYTTETDASFDAGSLFPSTAPLYTAETDASFDERSLFPGTTDPDASFDATSLLAPAVAAPVREDSLPPAPALSRRHSGQPGNGHSGTPTRVLNAIQPGLWKPGTPIRFGGRSLQAAVREAAYDPERSRTLEESLVGRKAEEVTTAESPEEALEAPDSDFIALSEGHTTDTADAALALQADPPIGDSASAEAEAPFHSEDGPAAMSPVRQASQEPESTLLPNMQEASNDKGTGGSAPIPVEEYTDAVPDYLPAASASGSEQERLSSEALDQEAGDDEEEANALVAILLSPKGKTFTTSGTAPVANRASVRSKGKGRRSQTPEASVRASPRGRSQTRREGRSSSDSGPVERRRSSRSDSGAEPVEEHEPPRVTDQAAAGDEEEDDSDIKEVAASRSPAKIALSTVTATGADSTPIKRRSISQSQRVLLPSTPEHAEPAPGNATEEAVEDMEVVSLLTTRPSRPRFHKHGESHSEAAQRRQAAASATERTSARGGVPSHDITTGQSPAVVHPRMERDDHKHGLTSSPITTRSHCTYHKLSIPNPLLRDGHRASGADTPLRRMSTRLARAHESTGAVGNHPSHYVFLVPGCCVTRDLIDKESSAGSGRGMEDLGVANNDEEGKAIRILSIDEGGDGEKLTVTGIPDEVIQSLIRVVGLELFRDGDCEILGPIATRSTEGQDESKAVSPSAAPAGPLPPQSERKRRRESDMGGMTGTPHKRAK